MCPSSCIPLPAENEYWTDEAIYMLLFNFKRGKRLPLHVSEDVNPYQYRPSELPPNLWYLWPGVKKDAECGFCQETGEPCETFSNSAIIGLRTTLQFYEGRALHSRKTDWMMQVYKITEKHDNNKKDLSALYRVFSAEENNTNVKIPINLTPKTVSTSELGKTPDPLLEQSSEMKCILRGDYFELNDLNDPGSRSASSANSSCLSMTSDEYFDSMALLQEIENDSKDSSVKFNLSAPLKSTEVFIDAAKDCKSLSISQTSLKEGKKERASTTKRCKMMKFLCFFAF